MYGVADTGFKRELNSYFESGASVKIEHLGAGLITELEKRKSKYAYCEYQEYEKDAPSPVGDGKATNHVILLCDGFPGLGIRLVFDGSGKYRVLGYWSEMQ
jgi:hypothetical protein